MTVNHKGSAGKETLSLGPAAGGIERKETKENFKTRGKLEKESSLSNSLRRRVNFRSDLSGSSLLRWNRQLLRLLSHFCMQFRDVTPLS
jgi:hypothetical protein